MVSWQKFKESNFEIYPYIDTFNFLDVKLRIQTDSHPVIRFLQNYFSRFRQNGYFGEHELTITAPQQTENHLLSIKAPGQQYYVFRTDNGYKLYCEYQGTGTVKTVWFENDQSLKGDSDQNYSMKNKISFQDEQSEIFPFIQIGILRTLATLRPANHLLHGAAVSWKDSGIIFLGGSGQGKTTLSIALVKMGFKFLSDDIACLNAKAGEIVPFPSRVNPHQSGVKLLSPLISAEKLRKSSWPRDIEDVFPQSLGQTTPLNHIFILNDKFGVEPVICRISGDDALAHAGNLLYTTQADPHSAISKLSSAFNQAECYELTIGNLTSTASLITSLVAQEVNA